jgi:hypothetical protein
MTLTPTDAEIEAVARAMARHANRFQLWTPEQHQNREDRDWRDIDNLEDVKAFFASLPPTIQRVPEGWCVVPITKLEEIAQWFCDYAIAHHAKGTEDGNDKARRNLDRAEFVRAMIAASLSPDPVKGEEE